MFVHVALKTRIASSFAVFIPCAAVLLGAVAAADAAEPARVQAWQQAQSLGAAGGLCVEIGCNDFESLAQLARTGRFLVQSLDRDPEAVAKAQQYIHSQGLYGLVSVLRLDSSDRLPYAENLVNLAVVHGVSRPAVPLAEVARVVCPGGMVLVEAGEMDDEAIRAAGFEVVDARETATGWRAGRKPWPTLMDQWTHPWHAADGNTVSADLAVGPPRRIRWIAGPLGEISTMVSAGGRNFYGGVFARDAFNGLRLWDEDLSKSSGQGAGYRVASSAMRPVAAGDRLLAIADGALWALDTTTGKRLQAYPEAGRPTALVHVGDKLVAVVPDGIRALDFPSGRLLWKYEARGARYLVASDQSVFFLHGEPRRGEKCEAICLELVSGKVRWQKSDEPWLPLVRRLVAHKDLVVFEVSTLADTKEGNAIHVASAGDGKVLWSRSFVPSMNHSKQARAMFIGDALWILEHLQCVALDPRTGEVRQKHAAGLCHCFPPVATPRFLFSGEMNLTDLSTGRVDANRITKANCSPDFGWIPANGLIYNSPKHCVCWPMLRGYSALAPQSPTSRVPQIVDRREFRLEKTGDAPAPEPSSDADWPCYRHDAWRSSATAARLPSQLKMLWSTSLGAWPEGEIVKDWRDNPFVRGPITAPVAAAGLALVARPDAHEVVAMDLETGAVRWRFTADGRVDTSPTIYRGLCLFGTRSGSVYCLRAADGRPVWRLRAAPSDEQIVAYGQVESPWPVPGSVLVIDDVAYFAAGRQPLADGGILLFAVQPATGQIRWLSRLDTVSHTNFYASDSFEFDGFDLLQREGDGLSMSRWWFDRKTGEMTSKASESFARLGNADPGVVAQRGIWTYAARYEPRFNASSERQPRPLAVFRENTLVGCAADHRGLFRRDFDAASVKSFNMKWVTGWAVAENFRKKQGDVWPAERLAKNASWSAALLADAPRDRQIAGLALAGDRLVVAASSGGISLVALDDGSITGRADTPPPIWDGIAIAHNRLLISTADGRIVCFGNP